MKLKKHLYINTKNIMYVVNVYFSVVEGTVNNNMMSSKDGEPLLCLCDT